MIRAILAVTDDNVMGVVGELPWEHNKIDMSWFVHNTRGDTVVMGSKTWDSSMPTPLPNRQNIVMTTKPLDTKFAGADIARSLNDLEYLIQQCERDVWIIGGANVIKQCAHLIEEYYVTQFHGKLEDYTSKSDDVVTLPLDYLLVDFERTFVREHQDLSFEIWKRV